MGAAPREALLALGAAVQWEADASRRHEASGARSNREPGRGGSGGRTGAWDGSSGLAREGWVRGGVLLDRPLGSFDLGVGRGAPIRSTLITSDDRITCYLCLTNTPTGKNRVTDRDWLSTFGACLGAVVSKNHGIHSFVIVIPRFSKTIIFIGLRETMMCLNVAVFCAVLYLKNIVVG